MIKYVFGRGVSLQETKILPQQSHNSVFFTAASTCKVCAYGTCFLFGSLFCRRKHEGQGHPSVLKASGYLTNICARGLPGWIFPTAKSCETYSTQSALLLQRFGSAQACSVILKILKKLLVFSSLAEIKISVCKYLSARALTKKIGLIFFFSSLFYRAKSYHRQYFIHWHKHYPQAIKTQLQPLVLYQNVNPPLMLFACVTISRLQLLSAKNFSKLLWFLNINQL